MRTVTRWSVGLAPVVLLVLGSLSRSDEEKVPLDKVPRAVRDAVKARFPDAKQVGAEKEVEGGKTVYEIAIKDKDQRIEVTLTPEGTVVEIEKQIKAGDMPRTVTKTLEEKYPDAQYKMIEEVFKVNDGKEKLAYYEVLLVTAGKKKLEVSVTPAGKVAREEDKGKAKE